MKTKVAERGQVTIPKELRKRLGIRAGTVLEFSVRGSTLIANKIEEHDAVEKVYGCLGKSIDTDKILRELRGEDE